MKFCCSDFEGCYYIGNQFGFNIRIVKTTSPVLLETGYNLFYYNKALRKTKK